jgi:anaerobic selenocysteine-containing dehydrogenase
VIHSKILKARKRGAELIVIDPRRISLAKDADVHIRPRLGTDNILLLAMINIIISEELYDRELVESWTTGFDKLAEHVKQYTPEEAERVSGVKVGDIKKIARIYATTKPASMQIGFKLAQTQCGFQISRSLAILSAITGNIQVPGGDLHSFYLPKRSPRLPELMGDLKHPTANEFPIHSAFPIFLFEGNMTNWGDLVLNDPQKIRSMIVSGANPAITWPNSKKVRKAW